MTRCRAELCWDQPGTACLWLDDLLGNGRVCRVFGLMSSADWVCGCITQRYSPVITSYAENPGVQQAPLRLLRRRSNPVSTQSTQKLNTGPTSQTTTSNQRRTVLSSSSKLQPEQPQVHDNPNPRTPKHEITSRTCSPQPPKMARKRKDPTEIKLAHPSRAEPTEKTLLQWAEERDLFAQARQRERGKGPSAADADAKTTGAGKKARRWDAKTGVEVKEGEGEESEGEDEDVFTPGQERVFEAILWSFTISTVHFMLDVLVQNQYAIDIKWSSVVVRTGQAFLGKPPIPSSLPLPFPKYQNHQLTKQSSSSSSTPSTPIPPRPPQSPSSPPATSTPSAKPSSSSSAPPPAATSSTSQTPRATSPS